MDLGRLSSKSLVVPSLSSSLVVAPENFLKESGSSKSVTNEQALIIQIRNNLTLLEGERENAEKFKPNSKLNLNSIKAKEEHIKQLVNVFQQVEALKIFQPKSPEIADMTRRVYNLVKTGLLSLNQSAFTPWTRGMVFGLCALYQSANPDNKTGISIQNLNECILEKLNNSEAAEQIPLNSRRVVEYINDYLSGRTITSAGGQEYTPANIHEAVKTATIAKAEILKSLALTLKSQADKDFMLAKQSNKMEGYGKANSGYQHILGLYEKVEPEAEGDFSVAKARSFVCCGKIKRLEAELEANSPTRATKVAESNDQFRQAAEKFKKSDNKFKFEEAEAWRICQYTGVTLTNAYSQALAAYSALSKEEFIQQSKQGNNLADLEKDNEFNAYLCSNEQPNNLASNKAKVLGYLSTAYSQYALKGIGENEKMEWQLKSAQTHLKAIKILSASTSKTNQDITDINNHWQAINIIMSELESKVSDSVDTVINELFYAIRYETLIDYGAFNPIEQQPLGDIAHNLKLGQLVKFYHKNTAYLQEAKLYSHYKGENKDRASFQAWINHASQIINNENNSQKLSISAGKELLAALKSCKVIDPKFELLSGKENFINLLKTGLSLLATNDEEVKGLAQEFNVLFKDSKIPQELSSVISEIANRSLQDNNSTDPTNQNFNNISSVQAVVLENLPQFETLTLAEQLQKVVNLKAELTSKEKIKSYVEYLDRLGDSVIKLKQPAGEVEQVFKWVKDTFRKAAGGDEKFTSAKKSAWCAAILYSEAANLAIGQDIFKFSELELKSSKQKLAYLEPRTREYEVAKSCGNWLAVKVMSDDLINAQKSITQAEVDSSQNKYYSEACNRADALVLLKRWLSDSKNSKSTFPKLAKFIIDMEDDCFQAFCDHVNQTNEKGESSDYLAVLGDNKNLSQQLIKTNRQESPNSSEYYLKGKKISNGSSKIVYRAHKIAGTRIVPAGKVIVEVARMKERELANFEMYCGSEGVMDNPTIIEKTKNNDGTYRVTYLQYEYLGELEISKILRKLDVDNRTVKPAETASPEDKYTYNSKAIAIGFSLIQDVIKSYSELAAKGALITDSKPENFFVKLHDQQGPAAAPNARKLHAVVGDVDGIVSLDYLIKKPSQQEFFPTTFSFVPKNYSDLHAKGEGSQKLNNELTKADFLYTQMATVIGELVIQLANSIVHVQQADKKSKKNIDLASNTYNIKTKETTLITTANDQGDKSHLKNNPHNYPQLKTLNKNVAQAFRRLIRSSDKKDKNNAKIKALVAALRMFYAKADPDFKPDAAASSKPKAATTSKKIDLSKFKKEIDELIGKLA